MDITELNKTLQGLENILQKVVDGQNKIFETLKPEEFEKVKIIQQDTNEMLRNFKKGDYQACEKLVEKYKGK